MRGAADISFCGAGPRGSGLITSREKGRVRALVRAREVEREENTIVFLLLVCLVCLPIAALSSLKTPLYAAILALDLLLLLVASAGATKMRLDGGACLDIRRTLLLSNHMLAAEWRQRGGAPRADCGLSRDTPGLLEL